MWEQVHEALNQSVARVITGVANLLPGMVALVIALAVSSLFAWILAVLLRRFLRGIDFDGHLERWGLSGMAEWSPRKSPTLLVARTAAWVVIFLGFLVGVAAFDASLTSEIAMRMFQYLPNVLAAAVLFLAGNVLARFMARGVLISAVNHNVQYARLLSVGVKWLVLVLAAAMALEHLGIGGRIVDLAFGILFGGIVLTLALAIGLGSKDLVSRSLERQATKPVDDAPEPFRHV
ncbi:MAG: mechanosensitive ion channel family protein [Deltaproteobacteria bacterium]